jgi:hypothetical protein
VALNVKFEIDDAEDEWNFSIPFDFIFSRMAFPNFKKGPHIVKQAFKHLAPGGYMEFQDAIFPFRSHKESFKETALARWGEHLLKAAEKLGKDWQCTQKYLEYMTGEGFVDIKLETYSWPLGPWKEDERPHKLGTWFHRMFIDWIEALSMACLTRSKMMTNDQVQLLLMEVRLELKQPHDLCAFLPM